MSTPLPASSTKHLDVVLHSLPKDHLTVFQLRQISATASTGRNGTTESGSTGTTGTTLWLGGQVLACYLSSLPAAPIPTPTPTPTVPTPPTASYGQRKCAVELGAGVGYLSLVLASLGYDVTSTDIPPVLDAVLAPNVADGLDRLTRRVATPVFSGKVPAREVTRTTGTTAVKDTIGAITVRELDWLCPDLEVIKDLRPDLIVTSDTIYHPALVPALFGTIARLSATSVSAGKKPPTVYLCLERRDSRMVDAALSQAASFGVQLKRIGHGRVAKSVERAGWAWKEEDWEGVEVYKGKWTGSHETEQDASHLA